MTAPQRKLRAAPDAKPRAVLYLRQSIARDDSVSLDLQETAGRDYCERVGYQVVDVVEDPGRTGRTLARRQVLDVIARVEQREVDVIVVWRWSRLARSRKDFAVVCDRVEVAGGRVESATEPIDVSTASGRLARGMMSEVAAWESEMRGEVWKETHARRRGLDGGGVPAQGGQRFGYQHERGTDAYELDPSAGPVLATMYRNYLQGMGFVSIARWLNEQGITTLAGRPWTRDRVTDVLDSGFGAGLLIYGKRAPGGPMWAPGRHPAVITEGEWASYRHRRDARTPASPTGPEARYLLSGWLRCGDCMSPMHATRLGVEAGYGYWCSRWAQTRSECRCVTVTRAKAERAVSWFLDQLADEVGDAAGRAAKAMKARTSARDEVVDLARRIVRLDERLTRLTHGWTEGLVPDPAYRRTRDEIMDARARLATEQVAAEERGALIPARPVVPPQLVRAWPLMPLAGRRQVLRPLLAQVEVHRPAESRRGMPSGVWLVVESSWGERFPYRE